DLSASSAEVNANMERRLRALELAPANCAVSELRIDFPLCIMPLSRAVIVNHHEWRVVSLQQPKCERVLRNGKAAHACDANDGSNKARDRGKAKHGRDQE